MSQLHVVLWEQENVEGLNSQVCPSLTDAKHFKEDLVSFYNSDVKNIECYVLGVHLTTFYTC